MPEFELFLLGVDWRHLTQAHHIRQDGALRKDMTVDLNSGMMAVVPSWKVLKLLDHPDLVAMSADIKH